MAVEAGITAQLFAPPTIVADRADAGDGSVLLRSTDPLGDYPVTVVHSVRAWAGPRSRPPAGRRTHHRGRLADLRLR